MVTDNPNDSAPHPPLREEIANSLSHGVGLVIALIALPLLIARSAANELPWGTVSTSAFAATVVGMYSASTIYHALPHGGGKRIFRTLEHCAIFLLIEGTYTPFTLVALRGGWGWTIFGVVWLLAAVGILLQSVATTKHRWLPSLLYLGLAWLIVLVIRPLSLQMSYAALMWLLWGGIAYTVGMAFFAARQVPYCHFIWHLFVMAGTSCHYCAVWQVV